MLFPQILTQPNPRGGYLHKREGQDEVIYFVLPLTSFVGSPSALGGYLPRAIGS